MEKVKTTKITWKGEHVTIVLDEDMVFIAKAGFGIGSMSLIGKKAVEELMRTLDHVLYEMAQTKSGEDSGTQE